MKQKVVPLFLGLFLALVASLFIVNSAAAWSGVTLHVRDSVNLQYWQHGGHVYLVNQDGDIVGVGILPIPGGPVIINHHVGVDAPCPAPFDALTCHAPVVNDEITLYVDFECQASGPIPNSDCPGTNTSGTPDTYGDTAYTQNGLGILLTRNIQTGTGPLAVSLSGISGSSISGLSVIVTGMVMTLGGATIFVARRRQG